MPDLPISQFRSFGDLVFVAGQIGVDADGALPSSFERQMRLTLASLAARLEDAGAALDSVLQTTVYLVDRADVDEMNRIYAEHFHPPWPARSTIVTGLTVPGLLFEIDAVAHRRE